MSLREDAAVIGPELVELRRALHREPEVGLKLPRTQARVLEAIDDLPLEVTTGDSLTSVTAVLRGGRRPGDGAPAVLLRGDMDGLPVAERSGVDFTSELDGTMHACGHDLHVAGLVGAARLLSARRADLPGDVVFMFQPGEEGWDGASNMIAEGVLDAAGPTVRAAYGLHVFAAAPTGLFQSRPGPLMAASDGLFVRVIGAGGHGSRPQSAIDPVTAACEMVTALQTMVTRRFDVFDPVVLTVGVLRAGTRRNIIPDEAYFEATVRTFSPRAKELVAANAVRVCEGIAQAHGLQVDARYEDEYPVTVNDADEHEFVADAIRDVFGEDRHKRLSDPNTGSEDFSRVLAAVPGTYVFLGADTTGDPDTAPGNHSPLATFDESVLPDGAALLAELAVRKLDQEAV